MKKPNDMYDEIKRRLRKRRHLALCVYGGFALFTALLAVWVILDFNITAQFICIFAEAGAVALLLLLRRRLRLANAFAPLHQGILRQKHVDSSLTIQQFTRPPGFYNKAYTERVASFAIEVDGVVERLELNSLDQEPMFEVGDRIAFSAALSAPVLLDRERELHLCPWCGTIFPRENGSVCYHCHLTIQ